MKVYLGSDHRGFNLKEKVKTLLTELGYRFDDLGALAYDSSDDYTFYAEVVARKVAEDGAMGILICGSGVGVDVVANKIDGVRSSIGKSADQVRAGRNDDDMNVLVIAADFTAESEAKDMVKNFLKTSFSGETRYIKRLDDIKKIEENN